MGKILDEYLRVEKHTESHLHDDLCFKMLDCADNLYRNIHRERLGVIKYFLIERIMRTTRRNLNLIQRHKQTFLELLKEWIFGEKKKFSKPFKK